MKNLEINMNNQLKDMRSRTEADLDDKERTINKLDERIKRENEAKETQRTSFPLNQVS